MAFNFSPKISQQGLVLYLDAANPKSYVSGSTTWNDLTGNGNHATLVNTPTFDSSSLGCISFNGVDTYGTIDSNASITMTQPTLIVACTKRTGNGQTVIAKGGYGSYWNYGLTNQTSTVFYARNNNSDIISPTFPASTTLFDIYALVWDGSTVQFYRNGVYGGSNNAFYSPSAINSLYFRIGCAWSQNSLSNLEFFNGKIATIQLYNRALSGQEILQNYNALKGRFGLT